MCRPCTNATEVGSLVVLDGVCGYVETPCTEGLKYHVKVFVTSSFLFTFSGVVFPGIFLIITGYMDCHRPAAALVLLSLSMGFCGFQFSSFFINHGDIAPKYAGTVFGFTNTGASVPGIIAPYIVGAITTNVSIENNLTY